MFHHATSTTPDLLAEWRWLLGGIPKLLGWSSSGDLFYVDERARVCRLDTGSGELEVIADSRTAFESLLEDADRASDVLLLPVVREFEGAHGPLPNDKCLGFTTLPVLGGGYSVENRFVISVAEHASFTGDVHRRIRDLPDGTKIQVKIVP